MGRLLKKMFRLRNDKSIRLLVVVKPNRGKINLISLKMKRNVAAETNDVWMEFVSTGRPPVSKTRNTAFFFLFKKIR